MKNENSDFLKSFENTTLDTPQSKKFFSMALCNKFFKSDVTKQERFDLITLAWKYQLERFDELLHHFEYIHGKILLPCV